MVVNKLLRRTLAALVVLALATAALLTVDARMAQPPSRFESLPATPWLVLDRQLGLVWQRCPQGMRFVDHQAGSLCTGEPDWLLTEHAERQAQRVSTPQEPWRLPDVRELTSLVDDSRCCLALDPQAFPSFAAPPHGPAMPAGRAFPFHTSSPHAQSEERWRVESLEGEVRPSLVQQRALLRLVRAATPQERAR